ncbi:hypothetical protein EVG20_g1328 [Dentipellis fragilis]|uniref:Uncharacterized protein n=1 Tax=Dentipellis fragilis TaxID=205917 RepID=A0A4Y9ZB52_9AGAM|nr:hypothetical protein EVG20_g1328 [Dentipellis fragilis]
MTEVIQTVQTVPAVHTGDFHVISAGVNTQVRLRPPFDAPPLIAYAQTPPVGPQGNHWCAHLHGDGSISYHYSNANGSYYYSNPDGSTYFNSGTGYTRYMSPDGHITETGN